MRHIWRPVVKTVDRISGVDNHGPAERIGIGANGFALLSNHYQAVKAAKALFEEDLF